eukprot:CFRG2162T1
MTGREPTLHEFLNPKIVDENSNPDLISRKTGDSHVFHEPSVEQVLRQRDMLKDVDHKVLKTWVDECGLEVTPLVRAIIEATDMNNDREVRKACVAVKASLVKINDSDFDVTKSTELTHFLVMKMGSLNRMILTELLEWFLELIARRENLGFKTLDIFGSAVSHVATVQEIHTNGEFLSGVEYQAEFFHQLCATKWAANCVVPLVAMFRDISMPSNQLEPVVKKIMRQFGNMYLDELPSLVYQLLLLATKGHKSLAICGIVEHFRRVRSRCVGAADAQNTQNHDVSDEGSNERDLSPSHLRHVEGTTLLHMSFAIKQDQDLGRDFLKHLKTNPNTLLTPFSIAVCLAISQIKRLETPVYDFLRSSITKIFKDRANRASVDWIADATTLAIPEIQNVLLEVVNCKWNETLTGLVTLAEGLVDRNPIKSTSDQMHLEPSGGSTLSPEDIVGRCCRDIGLAMLVRLFKTWDGSRSAILETCISRIMSTHGAASSYVILLRTIVTNCPHSIVQHQSKLMDIFDYMTCLSSSTNEHILLAVRYLFGISSQFTTSVMLRLRKMMFNKEEGARLTALFGFLAVVQAQPVDHTTTVALASDSAQLSQALSNSQSPNLTMTRRHSSGSLGLEVVSILRRFCTYQCLVKRHLYLGFPTLVASNPRLRKPILSIVYTQVMRYIDTRDNVTSPLRLNVCIGQSSSIGSGCGSGGESRKPELKELIPQLLTSTTHCLSSAQTNTTDSDDAETDEMVNNIVATVDNIVERMIKCTPEDFEIDQTCDFSANEGGALLKAEIVIGTCEALIEYIVKIKGLTAIFCQKIISLYDLIVNVRGIVTEKAGKGRKKAFKAERVLSHCVSVQVLCAVFDSGLPQSSLAAIEPDSTEMDMFTESNDDGINVLRERPTFIQWLLEKERQALELRFREISEVRHIDETKTSNKESTSDALTDNMMTKLDTEYHTWESLGAALLPHYIATTISHEGNSVETIPTTSNTTTHEAQNLILEVYLMLVRLVKLVYTKRRMVEFLTITNPEAVVVDTLNEDDNLLIHSQVLQSITYERLKEGTPKKGESLAQKSASDIQALSLLSIIALIASCMEDMGDQYARIIDWVERVCVDVEHTNERVARGLVSLVLNRLTGPETLDITLALAKSVHYCLGDISNQNFEDSSGNQHALVSTRLAHTVISEIVLVLGRTLNQVEWIIGQLVNQVAGRERNYDATVEVAVIDRLLLCTQVFIELTQSRVEGGPAGPVRLLFQRLRQYFDTMTALIKLQIALHKYEYPINKRIGGELCKTGPGELSENVYALISHLNQFESDQSKSYDKKVKRQRNDKARIMRESRLIPDTIYAIETLGHNLIMLSKKTKNNYTKYVKRSTARDFKIQSTKLNESLEEQAMHDDQSSDEDEKMKLKASKKFRSE